MICVNHVRFCIWIYEMKVYIDSTCTTSLLCHKKEFSSIKAATFEAEFSCRPGADLETSPHPVR